MVDIKLNFRYNNVTGELMGVSFSDGKHSFSGKKLDNSLVYSALSIEFGDLKKLAHDNVKSYYEAERDRLISWNDWSDSNKANIIRAFPDFDKLYTNGADSVKNPNIQKLLGFGENNMRDFSDYSVRDYSPLGDGENGFISLNLLITALLQPYQAQLSKCGGGGGGGNDQGWRDKDDDWKRFKFRFSQSKQQQRTKSRRM